MQKILPDMPLGNNIKRLRHAAGWTQVDMIAKMQMLGSKVTRTSYVKMENGYRNIKTSDLVILRKLFEVSYDEFFAGFDIQDE